MIDSVIKNNFRIKMDKFLDKNFNNFLDQLKQEMMIGKNYYWI